MAKCKQEKHKVKLDVSKKNLCKKDKKKKLKLHNGLKNDETRLEELINLCKLNKLKNKHDKKRKSKHHKHKLVKSNTNGNLESSFDEVIEIDPPVPSTSKSLRSKKPRKSECKRTKGSHSLLSTQIEVSDDSGSEIEIVSDSSDPLKNVKSVQPEHVPCVIYGFDFAREKKVKKKHSKRKSIETSSSNNSDKNSGKSLKRNKPRDGHNWKETTNLTNSLQKTNLKESKTKSLNKNVRKTEQNQEVTTIEDESSSESSHSNLNSSSNYVESSYVDSSNNFENENTQMDTTQEYEGVNSISGTSLPSESMLTESVENISISDNEPLANCQFYLLNNACIVILKYPTKLYFHGVLKASCIHGKIEILGYNLTYESRMVYSLRGSSFLCFETLESDDEIIPTEYLRSVGLNNEIIQSLSPSDCILKFEYYKSKSLNFIDKYIEQNIIPNVNKGNAMEKLLKCNFEYCNKKGYLYNKNFEWNYILASAMENLNSSKILLCGGKSVGKSTLLRYIVNQFLSVTETVLCIDLDIGQSEFSVPGCVSATLIDEPLLGPNFTHLKSPKRSYFVGTVNASDSIERYFQSIKYLLNYCLTNEHLKNIPWVINTMGFVRGLGHNIMIKTIRMLHPTVVVQIESEKRQNNFEEYLYPHFILSTNLTMHLDIITEVELTPLNYELIMIKSVAKNVYSREDIQEWSIHPKDLRSINALSYISEILKSKDTTLFDVTPYMCNLNNLKLVCLNGVITKELLPCAFNGNFAALCTEENVTADYVNYICLGFGIIRGIDNNEVYLLTPLSLNELKNVTNLVLAAEPLPASVYLKTDCCSEYPVPYVASTKQIKTTQIPRRVTFNLLRAKNLLPNINKA